MKLAAAAIGNKTGGGIEVPLTEGLRFRLGLHNYQNGAKDDRLAHTRADDRSRREVLT